jgi:hypothetical protein
MIGCSDSNPSEPGVHPCSNCPASAIDIVVTFATCELIRSLGVAPSHAVAGSEVTLGAEVDPEAEGEITYLWTATLGTVTEPAALTTRYRSDTPGESEITLIVNASACTDAASFDFEWATAPVVR